MWFNRRASTRMRSELMAAIYDKALKRKDFSGIIDKDKQEEAAKKAADEAAPALARMFIAVSFWAYINGTAMQGRARRQRRRRRKKPRQMTPKLAPMSGKL